MITASEDSGHYDFAVQCFEEMEERGVKGARAVNFSALNCCLHTKSWKSAELVLSVMHAKGIAATLESYRLMLEYYGEQGRVDNAVNLFIKLQDLGQKVDQECCHALMEVFEVAERGDMVIMLLNAMWDEKICVQMSTYISALRVFAKTSQWKQSLSILKRIVREHDVIPEEARQLVLQVARASNNEMIVKKLEDVFNNEIDGEDSSVSSE